MIKMKKNLILWRHAHAEIGNNDFNRHIDERGKKESKIMAEFIFSQSSPDLILSSPAVRAQETLNSFHNLYSTSKNQIDEIKNSIRALNYPKKYDVIICEVGGTVGDIESLPFMESIRQMSVELGYHNHLIVHVTLVPYIQASEELKI